MRRYYALLLTAGGGVQLVKMHDGKTVLAEKHTGWQPYQKQNLALRVAGERLVGLVKGTMVFDLPMTH